jgi:uncharacterized protein (TIGR02001 family)
MRGGFFGLATAAFAGIVTCGGAVAQEKSALSYSFNVAITSDYVFRGVSQSAERPTGQVGFDVTWGKFYTGVWASGIDFGNEVPGFGSTARAEVDLYAGWKPEWAGFSFDLGGIYYAYPGARDNRVTTVFDKEADYFELKAGVSREVVKNLTLAATLFWSPVYTNGTGTVWTAEAGATYVLPQFGIVTPSLSALYGYQKGDSVRYAALVSNGSNNYSYWNAGITLGVEKFSFDLRYWDTNIKNDGLATGFCTGTFGQCDQRFMGTFKFTY